MVYEAIAASILVATNERINPVVPWYGSLDTMEL